MNNFELVIGVEIHIELNTKTKMFSGAANNFNSNPNENVSEIDLGYPGTMPVVNKEAVVKGVQLAKALNMKIDNVLHFDRKNYFYFDIPKCFQITQQDRPIGSNGFVPIEINNQVKNIEIERIHLEEDTAKSTHQNNKTYLDYNRAGVPLIEIVSKPVLRNAEETALYIDAIRKVAKALNISDAKMEEGSLRADVNISIRLYGQKEFGTKVEIKNINSISNVKKAIAIEYNNQVKSILNGQPIEQATKRYDDSKNDVITMRVKTDAADYRYFPEPNIPPIKLDQSFIDNIKINELPWETKSRLSKLKIDNEYIDQLIADREKLEYFDAIDFSNKNKVAKLFFAEIVSLANNTNKGILELNIDPHQIKILIEKQEEGTISGSHIKKIIPLLSKENSTVEQIIEKHNFKQISDENILKEMINNIILSHKEFIEANKERSERVQKFILGQLMKESKGQANPIVAMKILIKILGE